MDLYCLEETPVISCFLTKRKWQIKNISFKSIEKGGRYEIQNFFFFVCIYLFIYAFL